MFSDQCIRVNPVLRFAFPITGSRAITRFLHLGLFKSICCLSSNIFGLPHPPYELLLKTKAQPQFERPVESLLAFLFLVFPPLNRVAFFACARSPNLLSSNWVYRLPDHPIPISCAPPGIFQLSLQTKTLTRINPNPDPIGRGLQSFAKYQLPSTKYPGLASCQLRAVRFSKSVLPLFRLGERGAVQPCSRQPLASYRFLFAITSKIAPGNRFLRSATLACTMPGAPAGRNSLARVRKPRVGVGLDLSAGGAAQSRLCALRFAARGPAAQGIILSALIRHD